MSSLKYHFLKLNRLILFLALTATILTFIISFYSNYEVQKAQLISQRINVNQAYAHKLADTTEVFLKLSRQQLAYTANGLGTKMHDQTFLTREANRLKYQTDSFNSVVISNAVGVTQAASPETLGLVGRQLTSVGSRQALNEKKALISKPYISTIDNLLVFISTPIFSPDHDYLGFLGGTIYLKKPNILREILGEHFYHNGSYIYVVDNDKKILYHPEPERIGTIVENNTGLDEIIAKKEGGLSLRNSRGIDMLAGYSTIPSTGWTVVTQSPLASSLLPLTGIMETVILKTLPMTLGVFVFIWLFARAISHPLMQLADKAKVLDSPNVSEEIESINSWYVESSSLKKAILSGVKLLHTQIGQLKLDADTDPLTGAKNRRALQYRLEALVVQGTKFSLLSVDIDYFKKVNDTFGHHAGDEVLKQQVAVMNRFSRAQDMVARTGGEEFVLLLTETSQDDAFVVAERLREAVSNETFEEVGHITVSIGIGAWLNDAKPLKKVLLSVDEALYAAKANGRNCCVMGK
ncbi:sensor domain-containing diguanylate cyclase [Marinomonas pollencensis]|uniref:diguanylate cyclase n=1 Tax=Marinomonas pollencensis TaxID=491954 RepID=A0A3E0DM73_9GAMM|nr:sensor domain-containing diguanylate cyclase [Marinomonas pollencensis]REG83212.1 diguanylate cyclase (GGDEF)-like protein [Marinomonas pollencensis]